MGEYAIRKSDKQRIKMGTCESMYYLRLEDKNKVTPDHSSCYGHYWRLPFPDEDNIKPGDYNDHNRGLRLYKTVKDASGKEYTVDYENPAEFDEYPGFIQLHHKESGMLLNVPCYHGRKLPEVVNGNAFWNGKGYSMELRFLRSTESGEVFPIVACQHCNHMWRQSWEGIWDYLPPLWQSRLRKYRAIKNVA